MPAWLHKDSEEVKALETVNNTPEANKASLPHELLAGAATAYAAHAWEEHQKKSGKEVKHEKLKEFAAGAAGAFLTNILETKGKDALDAHKAKKELAHSQAEEKITETLNVTEVADYKS